ncbi:RNA polymerase sigma-70 factor [Solitalea lacus]|uniref:RNA polymerase sigma-70 factor n=1 Tax=Solitalea lacus TaxID=2911172 RepID=UPI001EDB1305|nr:RNA polymerase sigma-70 factor [Solitalea lacus]UKJ08481.1 RNA polymerase sigma-70 factor [Solitalea lacus]
MNNLELWPDHDLLDLMRNDDRSAFETIYNKYWSKLYLSAFNLLRNRHAAEDIVQEIFVQLWLKRHVNQVQTLQSYLYTAVRFQVFKAIRDGKAHEELFEEVEKLFNENNSESRVIELDIRNRLDQAIKTLPEKCQQVFVLSRKEHLSNKEIAEQLGISPKTVENHLTIALRQIRSTMGDVLFIVALFLLNNWN